MVQSDPWNTNGEQITIQSSAIASQQSFEDDFQPSPPPPPSASDRLPDSLEYLQSLEKKLQKLQTDTNVVDQLKARREQCMENLLRDNITLRDSVNEDLNRLEEDFEDNRRRDLARFLVPEQALNTSELIHIINHDQLEASVQTTTEETNGNEAEGDQQKE